MAKLFIRLGNSFSHKSSEHCAGTKTGLTKVPSSCLLNCRCGGFIGARQSTIIDKNVELEKKEGEKGWTRGVGRFDDTSRR